LERDLGFVKFAKEIFLNPIDLLIIGGGINGTGIACDAAGRGLSVHLCEQHDLASGTSSKSSKLIHGGLRYLEYYEFRLVHEALKEREILLRKAPHLIMPLSFVLPHHPGLRPAWLIRLGLFLYDHLAKRSLLPKSKTVNLQSSLFGSPLQSKYQQGFVYPDCWVDDARLVVSNAIAAKELGAQISPYCKVEKLRRVDGIWHAQMHDQRNGNTFTVSAHAVINATGPWIHQFLQEVVHGESAHHLRMVKGSHIIVPALYQGEQAYILQQTDERIVFAIPFQQQFTLIGTTDVDYVGDPANAVISSDEINYLCEVINDYFKKSITPNDIVTTFSGVRSLFENKNQTDAKSLSRDYTFEIIDEAGKAPLLSILGGKITTYRRLAEHALEKLAPYFSHMKKAWTHDAALPGGDIPDADFIHFYQQLCFDYPDLPADLLHRYARQYGTRCYRLLAKVEHLADLGQDFGATCYQREIEYLRQYEWLSCIDDLLYRRTHLGLFMSPEQVEVLKQAWGK
jgi:glycerol-3-phosphate dehydrogenase